MRYIKSFADHAAIQGALDNGSLVAPYLALNDETHKIEWTDYSKLYFTIEAKGAGNLKVRDKLSYSVNEDEWVSMETTSTTISLNAGDRVRFKGTNTTKQTFSGNTISSIVYGNIMSLFYGDNFATATTLGNNFSATALFQYYGGLTDASNLILPATTLKRYCYMSMFQRCVDLEVGPVLPAPALVDGCYMHLFYDCWKLKKIVCLATSNLNSQEDWVYHVPQTGIFVKSPDATGWRVNSYNGIPSGWTVIDAQ